MFIANVCVCGYYQAVCKCVKEIVNVKDNTCIDDRIRAKSHDTRITCTLYIHTYVHTYIRTYICMYVCMYVHM